MGRVKGNICSYFKSGPAGEQCKYCKQLYKVKNATKMTKHIQKCTKCPLEVHRLVSGKSTSRAAGLGQIPCSTEFPLDDQAREGRLAITTPDLSEPQSLQSLSSGTTIPLWKTPSRSGSTSSLRPFLDYMDPTETATANQMLARAIYVSGAPLSFVEHPLWKAFFKKLRPAYDLPSRFSIATTLLEAEYNQIVSDVSILLADSKNLNLQCDGWSNIRNEGILNFIVTTPKPVFVKFVNTEDNRHTGDYLADEMEKILVQYGPEKFFVVIGDNAANMKKASKTLKERYPHLVPLGCLAHTLHLLCNDILSTNSVNGFIQRAVSIIKNVRQSQILVALFEKIKKEKKCNTSLHLPVKTRWGSYLNSLDSLIRCKVTLQTLAVNEEAMSVLPKDMKVQLLDDDVFSVRVESLSNVLKPIVKWITELVGDKPLIHKACCALDEIEKQLRISVPLSLLNKAEEKLVLEKMMARKAFAMGPIHYAATLLDPASQGHLLTQMEQLEAVEFIDKTSTDMTQVDSEQVLVDLANYRSKDDMWSKDFMWRSVGKIMPTTWWKGMCGSTDLSKVAVRILSSPITSAATERSFSTFSRIHTKRRNRLTTERAGKITFVAHNWSLNDDKNKSQLKNIPTPTFDEAIPSTSAAPFESSTESAKRDRQRRRLYQDSEDAVNVISSSESETEDEEDVPYEESSFDEWEMDVGLDEDSDKDKEING